MCVQLVSALACLKSKLRRRNQKTAATDSETEKNKLFFSAAASFVTWCQRETSWIYSKPVHRVRGTKITSHLESLHFLHMINISTYIIIIIIYSRYAFYIYFSSHLYTSVLCTVFVFTLGVKGHWTWSTWKQGRGRESYEPKGSVVIRPLASNRNSARAGGMNVLSEDDDDNNNSSNNRKKKKHSHGKINHCHSEARLVIIGSSCKKKHAAALFLGGGKKKRTRRCKVSKKIYSNILLILCWYKVS